MTETDSAEGVQEDAEAGHDTLMVEEPEARLEDVGGGRALGKGSPFAESHIRASGDEPPEGLTFNLPERSSAPAPDPVEARAAEAAQALFQSQLPQAEAAEGSSLPGQPPGSGATGSDATEIGEPVPKRRSRQDKYLVALLAINLCLMGVMIALPGAETKPPADGSVRENVIVNPVVKGPNPFISPLQMPDQILPNSGTYYVGLELVGASKYEQAVRAFESYLKGNPGLQAFQLQMVYSSLAYCHKRLGNDDRARAYQAKIDTLREISALPEDLWDAAQRAEKEGRGLDMRRAYARFLLQQDQLGKRWTTQGRIAEAYLKIGDSYRIDAERGARRQEAELVGPNAATRKPGGQGDHR